MLITKLEHACLLLEIEGKRVFIDPGSYTREVGNYQEVDAVVITHTHDDHCSEAQLDALLKNNPNLEIYGTAEVQKRLSAYKVTAVHHGDFYQVGQFQLEFFGDLHLEIHRSIPIIQNCGVLVNRKLYYPGDSYTQPDVSIEILACPTSAPWLKIGDVMDFIAATKPARCFPTHNVHLSEIGHELNNSRVRQTVESLGGVFEYLLPGESTQLDLNK